MCFLVWISGPVHIVGTGHKFKRFVLLDDSFQVLTGQQLPLAENPLVTLALPFVHNLGHVCTMHPMDPALFGPLGSCGLFHILNVTLFYIHFNAITGRQWWWFPISRLVGVPTRGVTIHNTTIRYISRYKPQDTVYDTIRKTRYRLQQLRHLKALAPENKKRQTEYTKTVLIILYLF